MTDEEDADEIRRSYRIAFGSAAGQGVLADLAPFCRAAESCVVPGDHDRTLLLEGRREVWLRIAKFMILTQEEIQILNMRRYPVRRAGDEDAA